MYKPIDQNAVSKRINDFMASKSPWKTFSKSIASKLTPSAADREPSRSDIAYEPLGWTSHELTPRTHFRKLASR